MDGADYARDLLFHDLESEFVTAIAVEICWIYDSLANELSDADHLVDKCREEEFNKRRGDAVRNGLMKVCRQFGVPFQLVRLTSNGQHKIVISAGRVIIIQEAVDAFNDKPEAADYKVGLSDIHGYVRQLELDLGDRPLPDRTWSGCVLAVLLHGPVGRGWSPKAKQLGTLSLGVPDASYQYWVVRPDLHAIALYGNGLDPRDEEVTAPPAAQEDNVVVRRKRRNSAQGSA